MSEGDRWYEEKSSKKEKVYGGAFFFFFTGCLDMPAHISTEASRGDSRVIQGSVYPSEGIIWSETLKR